MTDAHLDDTIKSARTSCSAYAEGCLLPGGYDLKRTGLGGGEGHPGERAVITGFSASARRTAIKRLMAMPLDRLVAADKHVHRHDALFTTLTYPDEYPRSWRVHKAHLRAFVKRLERCPWLGYQGLFWKLEQQKRGAPHYHILLRLERPVSVRRFADWAYRAWFDIVGSGDLWHLRHGVDVRPVYQAKGGMGLLMRYMTKYLAKTWRAVDENGEYLETGRTWGICGDMGSVVVREVRFMTRLAWVEFQRRIRRWGKKSPYLRKLAGARGVRIFGGIELLALLRGLNVRLLNVRGTRSV